jgi:hypothetical protein
MDRTILKTVMLFNRILILGVIIFGQILGVFQIFSGHSTWSEFFLLSGILGIPAAYLIFSDRGYRISYDDEAVYMRPDGLDWRLRYGPELEMRYEEISAMCGEWGKGGFREAGAGLFLPFEYIRLYRKSGPDDELFYISPVITIHEEMQELIRFIISKRPDVAAKNVLDYLASDRRM